MMKMQGNTTEIDERNLLRLDALIPLFRKFGK